MLALINGSTSKVRLAKATDNTLRVIVAEDDGSPIDITSDAIDLLVYQRSDRANAAIATHSDDTVVQADAGYATVALGDAELNYGPGEYYMFVRYTDVGATKVYWSGPFSLEIY